MDLELVAIPGLGTLTARLSRSDDKRPNNMITSQSTYSLAGGDLKDLGGKTDRALDTELLVLRAVDQVRRD